MAAWQPIWQKFNKGGEMAYWQQSYLTDTVSEDGDYRLWTSHALGRLPKHDPESVADDMKCIFSIAFNEVGCRELAYYQYQKGDPFKFQSIFPIYGERLFLIALQEELNERNIKHTIKARGRSERWGKQKWQFTTLEYLIYAESNGVLAKLIGLDTIEEAAWRRAKDKVDRLVEQIH